MTSAMIAQTVKSLTELSQRFYLPLLVSIILLGGVLRAYNTHTKEPWFDEYCTIRGVAGVRYTLEEKTSKLYPLLNQATTDSFTTRAFPAIYTIDGVRQATLAIDRGNGFANNLLLYGWFRLWGMDMFAGYLLVVLFALVSIALAVRIVEHCVGRGILPLSVGILMSVSPLLIQFSDREIRSYGLAVFGCLLSTYILIRLLQEKVQRATRTTITLGIVYAIGMSIAFFSHYLTVGILASHFVVMCATERRKAVWFAYLCAGGILILLVGIWFSTGGYEAYTAMSAHSNIWRLRAQEPGSTLAPTLFNITNGAFRQLSNVLIIRTGVTTKFIGGSALPFLAMSIASFIALLIGVYTYHVNIDSAQERNRIVLWWIAVSGSIASVVLALVLAISSQHTLSFIFRYATFSAPFGCMLVVLSIQGMVRLQSSILRSVSLALIAVQIAFVPISLASTYSATQESSEKNIRTHIGFLQTLSARDTIVFQSGYDAIVANALALPKGIGARQRVDTTVSYRVGFLMPGSQNQQPVLQVVDSVIVR